MAQLVVRRIEEGVKRKLRSRAARHGRSMEEEVREILRAAASEPQKAKVGLGTRIAARFEKIGLDFDIPELRGFKNKPARFRR